MMARNHVVCGIAALGLVAGAVGIVADIVPDAADAVRRSVMRPETLFCLPLYVLGCLAPDIDSPSSVLGRYMSVGIGHRTIFHAVWIPAILLWFFHTVPAVVWFCAGYLVHLFVDSFSVMGVCFFWPYPGYISYPSGVKVKRHHVLGFYHAGTDEETVCATVFVALSVVVFVVAVACGNVGALFGV